MNKRLLFWVILFSAAAAAGGILVWQSSWPDNLAPAQWSKASERAPKDWQTYAKEELNFQFRYPQSLVFKFEAQALPKLTSGKIITTFFFKGEPFELTLVTNAPGAPATTSQAKLLGQAQLRVGGLAANRQIFQEPDGQVIPIVVFEKGPVAYSFFAKIKEGNDDKIAVFDQILSTFKFLRQNY